MPRHYRRSRTTAMRPVIQSFKKVLNYAPASRAAGAKLDFEMATGQDSVAAGQTGPTDVNVPTGSIIKSFTIQYSCQNLVNIASFLYISVQRALPSQTTLSPNVIGGSNQRNQVHLQMQKSVGQNQQVNFSITFKVPKKYQRVREGARWVFVTLPTQIQTDALQVIYKFYR